MLADYDMILSNKPSVEVTLIRDALKLAKPTLEFPGKVTNHVCSEMIGRLSYFKNDFPNLIGKLVTECKALLLRNNTISLIPMSGCFPPPGGPLRTTLTGMSKPVTCMAGSHDSRALFVGSRDGTIMIWEVGLDEVLHTIHVHSDAILCFTTCGLKLASSSTDNTLSVINWDTGSIVASIKEDHSEHNGLSSLALSEGEDHLISACGNQINIWNISSSTLQLTLRETNSSYISCDVLLNAGNVIAGYKNGSVLWWSLEKGEIMHEVATPEDTTDSPVALYACSDALVSLSGKGNVNVYNVQTAVVLSSCSVGCQVDCSAAAGNFVAFSCGKDIQVWKLVDATLKRISAVNQHRDRISSLKFNQSGNLLLSGSEDQTMLCWLVG
uniref:Uncharacterized protein n=1 Tax=Ciona savignyi TaxID=51511 RepID=H2YVJ3_CIOSA